MSDMKSIVERGINMMAMSGIEPKQDSMNPIEEWMYDAEQALSQPDEVRESAQLLHEAMQISPQRVYIAGPMTGIENYNFPAFNDAATNLRAAGWDVVNPADHGVIEGAEWGHYLRADLARMVMCSDIYLLPGWSKSKGARLEHSVATSLGMGIDFAPGAERETDHPADVRGAEADPAYDRHTSELLDSQAYQLEQLAKAVLAGDEKAKQLAEEVLS